MKRFIARGATSRVLTIVVLSMLAVAMVACSSGSSTSTNTSGGGQTTAQPTEIVLASTTSTEDSGLFDVLLPAFQKAYPEYKVNVVAVGSGEALKLGQNKDADVLLVHAKDDEIKFVQDGYGVGRYEVMYNDFVIVGPKDNPAGLTKDMTADAAFAAIAKAGESGQAVFVSRADDSGTNKKELKIWKSASIVPTETPNAKKWYVETGQGMGETLKIASEKQAYTLADRATYLTSKDALDLEIITEKDKGLLNQYGVLPVTDAKNLKGGEAFATWITSPEGQKVVGDFGVEKFGEQLFTPNATGTAEFAQ